jgi:hypothetical protein
MSDQLARLKREADPDGRLLMGIISPPADEGIAIGGAA